MLWSRKNAPVHDRNRIAGLDLTASRVRGVTVGGGKYRPLLLDEPAEELMMFLACDRRTPEAGRAGYALSRKLPHAVCSNFLPALGRPQEWRAGRFVLTAEAALGVALDKVRGPVEAESSTVALVLPAYLAPDQIGKAVIAATRAKLPLKGTAAAPLAPAASRAASVLHGKPQVNPIDGIVPLRPTVGGPASVVVIDADEYALSATVIGIDREAAKLLATTCWPRLGFRVWKDKLLDAVADRCIRLCRRDPRDSAEAEQALFEQLDDALDRARAGQRVSLTVRTSQWFQDLVQPPDEFDGYCASLARTAAESIREMVAGSSLPVPPRAVWLTHDAGRLPGLVKAVHLHTPEGTAVEALAAPAVALAAAALIPRWLNGDLPRTHLDTAIGLSAHSSQLSAGQPKAPGR